MLAALAHESVRLPVGMARSYFRLVTEDVSLCLVGEAFDTKPPRHAAGRQLSHPPP